MNEGCLFKYQRVTKTWWRALGVKVALNQLKLKKIQEQNVKYLELDGVLILGGFKKNRRKIIAVRARKITFFFESV